MCEHNLNLRIRSTRPGEPDFYKKKGCRVAAAGLRRRPAALVFVVNPAGRDAGMDFGDVDCVRILSFAINSNPFSSHSD